MNKQFIKFLAFVLALGLLQALFSIAFARSPNAGSEPFLNEQYDISSFAADDQIASSSGMVYVTISNNDLVSVIDPLTHTEFSTINMGAEGCFFPWRATMSPYGDYVYIGCYDSSSVAVIEITSNTVVANVGGIPSADDVAFTLDGAYALVGSRWNNQVAVVDTTSYIVTNYIPTPGYAWSIASHPSISLAYITSGDGTIQVMDTTTFSIVDSIMVGGEPWDVAVSPNGQWVFATDRWGAGLHVLDTNTNTLFTTITGLGSLTGVEVAPQGDRVYVNTLNGGVHVIDAQTFTPITLVPAFPAPWELETSCDGSEVYLGTVSSQVPVLDTNTYSLTHQIPVSGYGTRGIALCPQYSSPNVLLSPVTQLNQGAPGEMVAHELTLTNATGATDSFTLTVGAHAWDTSLSTSMIGSLGNGESITFTVYVTVPVGTDWYLTETTLVTATSVISPNDYFDSAQLTTEAYAPPEISVFPDSLSSSQFVNEIMSQTMTITNGFGVTLTFGMYELDNGFIPTLTSRQGQGEWLYQDEQGVQVQNAQGENQTVYPSAYRWTPDQPSGLLNILVYADDWIHPAPATFIDQALQALGLGYTAHYNFDWAGFENNLNNGVWDIVLVGADNIYFPSSTFAALNTYVLGGGKLIIHSQAIPNWEPLWATVGFTYTVSAYPPPPPVEWWEPSHPAFNVPESVPELTSPNDVGFMDYAHYGNALSGFDAIAGYTPDPALNQAALIIGNQGRTVFKGFMDVQGGADLDGDTLVDGVELWINLINGIQIGFAGDVPWLSEIPITGTVTTESSQIIDVVFDSNALQPGEYYADLLVQNNDPVSPLVTLPVTMTVLPTANMGWVEGYVMDASTGSPLEATVIAFGQPYTITTDSGTGYYKLWLDAGAYTLQVSSSGYVSETANINITAQQGIIQDFELVLNVPVLIVSPDEIESTQLVGEVTNHVITITNAGPALLSFEIIEQNTTPGILALSEYARSEDEMIALLEEAASIPDPHNQGIPTIARYPVEAFATLESGVNILAWITYADYFGEYQNTLNALAQYTTFTVIETTTTDAAELAQLLAYTDVFLIPEQENASYSFLYSIGTNWTTVLNNFVQAGGTIIVMDHCFQSPGLVEGAGLVQVDYYNCGGDWPVNVVEPNHPLVENLPSTFTGANGTGVYTNTNGLNVISAEFWSGSSVVTAWEIGSGHVVLMGFDFFSYNDEMAQVLANAVNWLESGDVPWLSTSLISGTVSGYSFLPVEVTLDATGLQPGMHTANLIVESNDPLNPTASIPVTMTVQPTTNMGSVAGTATDAWTGEPITVTVQMVGVYTTTANPGYTIWAEAGNYTLMAYAPGYYTGTWPVTINAGSQTVLDIALEPFESRLDFAPFPLDATVPQGFNADYTFVISNTGPAPLLFDLHEISPTLMLTLDQPDDLNGKNILYDRAHGEDWQGYFSTLITDTLIAAGANVDYNTTYPISAATLDGYDVLWVNGGYSNWTFGELTAILNWLNNGGAILVHGEGYPSNVDIAGIYNILYDYGNCNSYTPTTDILAHPITTGIDEIFIEYGCYHLLAPPEANVAVRDQWGQNHAIAYHEIGGKMVVIADEDFFDWNINQSDNLLFGLNVMTWLAEPGYSDVPWFSASPVTGTVPGHSAVEVTISFDATTLPLGSFEAILALEHNDPALISPVHIPVNLTVIGPEAGVSLTPAEFQASGLPGETVVYTLTVTNDGTVPDTFTLQVDSTWQAELSATTTPPLDPGESYTFTLSVTVPVDAADGESDMATVTAESNFDPTVTASVEVTTTAYLDVQKVFLPIVVR